MKLESMRTLWALGAVVLAVLVAGCSGSRPAAPADTVDPNVVATVGPDTVTVAEFERRYARSVGGADVAAADSLEAYRDYLQRYIDFRLKVMGALDAGLDEDAQLQQEIGTYRSQLARPYMLEQEVLEPIIRDLYEKSQLTVDASHILIQVGPDAPPSDTLAAYNRLASIVDSIRAGADFGAMAAAYSEDPSAQRPEGPGSQGRLGYFTSGMMVAPFEAAAYATPVDSLSPIIRTRFGYHVLYVHDRAEREPGLDVAHIMIRPGGRSAADTASALALVADLQDRLDAGEAFGDLARQYSDDTRSAGQGGAIGTIERLDGRVPEAFREAAFALTEEGAVSAPVETQFGYHLIQLLERQTMPTYQQAYEDLKGRANRLPRTQQAQETFARSAMADRGTSVDTAAIRSAFAGMSADSVFATLSRDGLTNAQRTLPVATIGDSTYTLGEVVAFLRTRRVTPGTDPVDQVVGSVDPFLVEQAIEYEAAALEESDDEFRTLMQEFRDGLLLFKFMEDEVWNAAAEDSVGLRAYYEAHAENYRFPERVRIIGLYSASDSLLRVAEERIQAGATPAELIADTTFRAGAATLRADTTRISEPTESIYDQALTLEDGAFTDVMPYRNGYALLLRDGTELPRQKTFEEARTEVLSTYQDVVEQRLLDDLRDQYPVETYPEHLQAAFTDVEPGAPGEVSAASQ